MLILSLLLLDTPKKIHEGNIHTNHNSVNVYNYNYIVNKGGIYLGKKDYKKYVEDENLTPLSISPKEVLYNNKLNNSIFVQYQ